MKKLFANVILSGLLLASIPAQAQTWWFSSDAPVQTQTWSQWFSSGLTSMKDSIVTASTETKIIAALTVAATAVGGYCLYRYLYPTDQELIDAANQAMNNSRGLLTVVPARILQAPVTDNSLRELYTSYGYSDPNSALWALYGAQQELHKQYATLKARFDKRSKEKAAVAITEPLHHCMQEITTLRTGIDTCYTFIDTHQHYLRMLALQDSNNTKYSQAIAVKNDMRSLVPIIRHAQSREKFPFIRFVEIVNYDTERIEQELRSAVPRDFHDLYTQKRGELRGIKADLETIRTTVLSSAEYAQDISAKIEYEKEQERRRQEEERLRIERERVRVEAERARIEQERLRLEREKNQREREQHEREHGRSGGWFSIEIGN